jgi:hypothetical protein
LDAVRSSLLPHAERNPDDDAGAEAVLEAVEDFLAAVADDFIEPGAAIDGDEERAFVQAGGLGVGDDAGVNEVVPDFDDFRLGAAFVHAQIHEHFREDVADFAGADGAGFFEGREVHAAPLGEDALAGAGLGRAELERAIGFWDDGHTSPSAVLLRRNGVRKANVFKETAVNQWFFHLCLI